jgi:hypothetical protein
MSPGPRLVSGGVGASGGDFWGRGTGCRCGLTAPAPLRPMGQSARFICEPSGCGCSCMRPPFLPPPRTMGALLRLPLPYAQCEKWGRGSGPIPVQAAMAALLSPLFPQPIAPQHAWEPAVGPKNAQWRSGDVLRGDGQRKRRHCSARGQRPCAPHPLSHPPRHGTL